MVCLFFRYISVQLITEETERARSIKLVCGIVYIIIIIIIIIVRENELRCNNTLLDVGWTSGCIS